MWSITKYLLELVRERGGCWVLEHSAPDQDMDVAVSCWLPAALCDISSACSWRHTTSTWSPLLSSPSPLSSGPKGSRSCVFIGTFTEDWFGFKCSDMYLPRCDFSDTARMRLPGQHVVTIVAILFCTDSSYLALYGCKG